MYKIMKGAEPVRIYKNKSYDGILLIHGFCGSPSELSFLINSFSKLDYNICAPLLPGHGTDPEDLNPRKFIEWIDAIEDAFNEIKNKSKNIIVIGFSMGGALALHLASKFKDEIKSLILINHAIISYDIKNLFIPLVKNFIKYIEGNPEMERLDNSIPMAHYTKLPLSAISELLKLQKYVRKNLSNIEIPVLIFKSIKDQVVPVYNVQYTLKRIKSKIKKVIYLNNSLHVAVLDYDKEIIFDRSIEFIKTL